jgi:hypothetical protein
MAATTMIQMANMPIISPSSSPPDNSDDGDDDDTNSTVGKYTK